jgi:hypothetical protein
MFWKRNLRQFSLRTLFVALLVTTIPLAYFAHYQNDQRAIAELQAFLPKAYAVQVEQRMNDAAGKAIIPA